MKEHSRAMLNSQQYFGKSKFVQDHFDGLFFEFTHGIDKYNEETLLIDKALLSRYVMVVVLFNDNGELGTYVRPHDSEDRINIPNKAYDLIIFDNISMRHGVPELEKSRAMIGFRNFDYYPMYFEKDPEYGKMFYELYDKINPGWIMEVDEEQSQILQMNNLKKWKESEAEIQLKKKPAF